MKRKIRNSKQKILLKLKIDKDLTWKDIEGITGYSRQNIDHAFKKNTEITINKVLKKLMSI